MARKRLLAEQIVTKLRQIEVLQAQGKCCLVLYDLGTTSNTQRILNAGDKKQKAHIRILQNIDHRIQPVIARPIRDDQSLVVQRLNKTRRITTRRDIGLADFIGRRKT